MKPFCAALVFLALSFCEARADKPPVLRYLGEWSDGRGEVLVVTGNKLRIGSHVASYKEIFRSGDLRFFRFHVTSGGGRTFDGGYFSVEVSREEMKLREYRTLADCVDDKYATSVVTWERDRY